MAREPKTPKAVTQLLFATAMESTKPAAAPDAIIDHEQIRRREQFEAIAKARTVEALSTMWRTLLEGSNALEFERCGYGQAIRRRAREVLLAEGRKAGNGAAGISADSALERLILAGDLPPRPGQIVDPPKPAPKAATSSPAPDNVTPITKAKRARKQASNG